MGTKIYGVGDIHGCFKELIELLDLIDIDRGDDIAKIVFLGDYVDRGLDSALVVDYLNDQKKNPRNGFEYVFLKGNHEDMLIKAIFEDATRDDLDNFYYNGGTATKQSYEDNNYIFSDHKDFYLSLERYHRHEDFFFVHAILPPALTMEKALGNIIYDYDALLWAREWNNHDGEFPENVFVIHGHTPVKQVEFHTNQVNIDTGCVFGKEWSQEYGQLTAVRLDGRLPEEIKIIQVRKKF